MKLSCLDEQDSFALLGPGFGAGPYLLMTDLQLEAKQFPRLIYVPFECDGASAQVLSARHASVTDVEFDVALPAPAVHLNAPSYAPHIDQIRQTIAAGDVYQVCYTVRATVGPATGGGLFTLLSRSGGPRFCAWVRLPDGTEFVSASPELYFEIADGLIHCEPMKGTASHADVEQFEGSQKEQAELAMITDLIRNDIAPICERRSVRVTAERRTIALPYAIQTVSDVRGVLRPGVSPIDALAALHPGGSVTGAPKQAAIEVIRSLEAEPRGAYCGGLGLWTSSDACVVSLLIRTARRAGDNWIYGVGSGVVYDSEASREYAELHTKLGALGCATRH